MVNRSIQELSLDEEGSEPRVPIEVLEAIDNLAKGNTARKGEIEAVLEF